MMALDDTMLMAFADGELDPVLMRDVADAVACDPEAQEKVRLFRLSTTLLRATFSDPAFFEVPGEIAEALEPPARRSSWRWRVALPLAASLALGIIGFGSGFVAGSRIESARETDFSERLLDEVADYHVIYGHETEHRVEVAADQRQQIETWLGDRLHRGLQVPDLAKYGLTFEGARLLVVDGQPVAQLMYNWAKNPNEPFAVCVSFGSPGEAPMKTVNRNGVNLAMWRAQGYTYVVVGWGDKSLVTDVAKDAMPQLAL